MIKDTAINRERSYLIYRFLEKDKSKHYKVGQIFRKQNDSKKGICEFMGTCKNASKEVFQYVAEKNDN